MAGVLKSIEITACFLKEFTVIMNIILVKSASVGILVILEANFQVSYKPALSWWLDYQQGNIIWQWIHIQKGFTVVVN